MAKKKPVKELNVKTFNKLQEEMMLLRVAVTDLEKSVVKIEPLIHSHDMKFQCPICKAELDITVPIIKVKKEGF